MRKDVREKAGLGSPPSTFTTNASESINFVLKQKVDFKESEWPEFNEKVKVLVNRLSAIAANWRQAHACR